MKRAARWQCHHCKEWVAKGEEHDCWTTTEAVLTRNLSEDLRDAWERIREPITPYVPGTTESYKDNARADRERAPGLRGSPALRDPFGDKT